MLLMEYIARDLLADHGIAIPKGRLIADENDLPIDASAYPAVLKAQVATGGRGKAGGIQIVNDAASAKATARTLFAATIKTYKVDRLLLVDKIAFKRELYLAILLDRAHKTPVVIFSTHGGIDIEHTAASHPECVARVPIDPIHGVQEYITRYLLDRSGLDAKHFDTFHDVLQRLYRLFRDNDCVLAEINPLMIDQNDRWIAADARITIDDSALPIRQQKLLALRDSIEREPRVLDARKNGFLYIPIEPTGTIAIMSNGSGMLMASLDALQQKGFTARCVLDLGGGATAERIASGIAIVVNQPGVRGLFANIFGGITRCDEIATGVMHAIEHLRPDQFIIIRMEGTNKATARDILHSLPVHRLIQVDRLSQAAIVMAERMAQA